MQVKCRVFSLFMLCVATVVVAAESENILKNGSFEYSDAYASPTFGWASGLETQAGGAAAQWEIDSTSGTAKDGKDFFRATVTAVSAENWHVQIKDPTWTAKVGATYHFSMWARSDEERSAQISVYGDADSKFTYRTSTAVALTKEWKQYHQMFISDASGAGQINFALVIGFAPGVYDIDNVVITEDTTAVNTLYANGDFEAEGSGWTLFTNSASDPIPVATVSYAEAGAQSGSKFCRVDVTTAPDSSWKVQLQDGSWTTELNGEYTFSIWAKADKVDAKVHIAVQAGSTRNYAYLQGSDYTLTTEWAQYSYAFIATDIAGPDSVSFNIYCGYGEGTYDFDNITLVLTPETSVETPVAVQKPAVPFSVSVLPGALTYTVNTPALASKLNICDIQGRLFYAQSLSSVAGKTYTIPRPLSGTYIVSLKTDRGIQSKTLVLP